MNKVIQEIIEQATHSVTSYFDGRGNITETYFDKEKFAELLLREFAEVIIKDSKFFECFFAIQITRGVIKDHFGIDIDKQY
jgi:hypothetical protein